MAALLTSASVLAQTPAKKPITHESLWMMKRVGSPVVSPDGKLAVFSINEPSYEADKAISDLWVVPTDGHAPPRRLTNTKAAEEGVAWSPDSRSIAFSTKREGDEVAQIYLLDLAEGGEARRVTDLSTGAQNPKFRPDGKAILFDSTVYPDAADDEANKKAAADRKARKYNVRVYEHFPVRLWNQWLDDRHPTVMVQSLEPGAKPRDLLSSTNLAKQDGFAGAPSGETGYALSPLWSPDGSEVLFTATTEMTNSAAGDVGYTLYHVSAQGGEPAALPGPKGDYMNAAFAPDGKNLFFEYAVQDQEIYHFGRLQRMAWPATGAGKAVAPDFDREIQHFAMTPDSREIYFLVPDAGKQKLYKVSAEGGKPELVIDPPTGGYTALEIPAKAPRTILIGAYGSAVRPTEVVRIEPAKQSHVNLTDIDTAAAEAIDWAAPEHFWFTSAKGRSIHNMIVKPPPSIRPRNIRCWCSSMAARPRTIPIRSGCAGTITCWPRPAM